MGDNKKLEEFFDDFETNTEEKTSIVQGGTFSKRMQDAEKVPPSLVLLMGPAGYVSRQWTIDNSDTTRPQLWLSGGAVVLADGRSKNA